jgi:hypothetical protein
LSKVDEMANRKRPGSPGLPFIVPIEDFVWLSFVTGLGGEAKQDAEAIRNFAALVGVDPEIIWHKVALEKQSATSELIELIDPEPPTVH